MASHYRCFDREMRSEDFRKPRSTVSSGAIVQRFWSGHRERGGLSSRWREVDEREDGGDVMVDGRWRKALMILNLTKRGPEK